MQKQPFREGRAHTILHQTIAAFLKETANAEPFITISYIQLNQAGTMVKVYCSIFPKEQEEQAFAFLKRKESLCREYIREHTVLRGIPTVRFIPAREPGY